MIFCVLVHTMKVKWVAYCSGTNIVQNKQVAGHTIPNLTSQLNQKMKQNNTFSIFSSLNCKYVLIALA